MPEIWKPARGYEGFYSVSDQGNAVRIANQGPKARKTWKPLRSFPTNTGYNRFCFSLENKRQFVSSHRAVWEAFNGPIPEGLAINHLNGNKTDNRLSNLALATPSENSKHAYRVLKVSPANNPSPGSKNGRAKLKEADIPEIRRLLRDGIAKKAIARQFGVSPALIHFIHKGVNWRHIPAAS